MHFLFLETLTDDYRKKNKTAAFAFKIVRKILEIGNKLSPLALGQADVGRGWEALTGRSTIKSASLK